MKFLLCAVAMSLYTISFAQDNCTTPEFQQIVPIEHLLGRWYAIGESDNFPQVKNNEACSMYHKKTIDFNEVSAYVLFFNPENRTELSLRVDYRMIFDSGSPTEGKFKLHFVTKNFEADEGMPCHVITLVPRLYYIYYCCHEVEGSEPRHIVHFLSNEKFPHPDLFNTMKKVAEGHGVPLDGMREITQEGCNN